MMRCKLLTTYISTGSNQHCSNDQTREGDLVGVGLWASTLESDDSMDDANDEILGNGDVFHQEEESSLTARLLPNGTGNV
jgi:hypothetical protein